MELEWVTNELASCCHAADGIARGLPLADSRLGEPFADAAQSLLKGDLSPSSPRPSVLVQFARQLTSNR